MSLPPISESMSESKGVRVHDGHGDDHTASDAETLNDAQFRNHGDRSSQEAEKCNSDRLEGDNNFIDSLKTVGDDARRRLQFQKIRATGPSGFNPTNARFHIRWKDDGDDTSEGSSPGGQPFRMPGTGDEVALKWSARYNRKGRNSFVVARSNSTGQQKPLAQFKEKLTNFARVLMNIGRMFITFPYWDMAFWSGWAYTWGSVLFVIDGGFSWVPLAFPYTKFKGEDYAVGLLFFFGALLYEVGATIAYLEAINDGSFHGSAMKRFLEGHEDDQKKLLDQKLSAFFGHMVPHSDKQPRRKKSVTRPANTLDLEAGWNPSWSLQNTSENLEPPPRARRGGVDFGATEEGETVEHLTWRWWPTWENFKSHHIREIGWWACSIQLFGATLYGITGIVALPGILDHLKQWQMNAAYWIPQIVASCCFLTASLLFTLETQEKWYKPEPKVLGWWIGVWATIGSCGFLLCGALGPAYGSSGAQYQSDLSSFWGSAAYLISGFLQWYEAVNKHPIEELLNEPGQIKSFQVHPV